MHLGTFVYSFYVTGIQESKEFSGFHQNNKPDNTGQGWDQETHQVINSVKIRMSIIDKFCLIQHAIPVT